MNQRRNALKFLLGGIAACASANVLANTKPAPEITVYQSPD